MITCFQNTNLLNKYCNILHTLYPNPDKLGEYADQLFNKVLEFTQGQQATSTVIIQDPTGETGHTWMYDAISGLVEKILSNDPSLDSTVRNDLLKDLSGLQQ